MTIDVIRTKGTHYEIGLQHGRYYRYLVGYLDFLRFMRELGLIYDNTPIRGPIFNFVINKALKITGNKMIKGIKEYLPNQFDKLIGIAEGFGMSTKKLAQLLAFETLAGDGKAMIKIPKEESQDGTEMVKELPAFGCTAGVISKGSQGFMMKNFDYPVEFEDYQVLRYTNLTQNGGYSSIGLTIAFMPGVVSGINEKGVCITLNAGFSYDLNKKAPPPTMAVQECLETCKNAEEAKEFLSKIPTSAGWFFTIADKDFNSYVVERSAKNFGILEPEKLNKKDSILTISNNCLCQDTYKVQLPINALCKLKTYWNDKPLLTGSAWRQKSLKILLKKLYEQNQTFEIKDFKEVMSNHQKNEGVTKEHGECVCVHDDYIKTLSTVYFNLKESIMYVNDGNPCSNIELAEHKLDFNYSVPDLRFFRRRDEKFPYYKKLN